MSEMRRAVERITQMIKAEMPNYLVIPNDFVSFNLVAHLFYALSPWWYVRWGLGLALGCFELYRIYNE